MNLDFPLRPPTIFILEIKKMGGLLVETTNYDGGVYIFLGLGLNIFGRPSTYSSTASALIEDVHTLEPKDWVKFSQGLARDIEGLEKFLSGGEWLAKIEEPLKIALNKNIHHAKNPVKKITQEGSLQLHQGYLNCLEL